MSNQGFSAKNMRFGRRSLLQAMGAAAVGISFGGLAACSKAGSDG